MYPVDRRWRLQVASSFGRMTRCLFDDVVPRGEPSSSDEREKTVTGTGTGAGKGTRTRTRMSTRAGMGTITGAGTGTRIERSAERRESLGTFEVVIEVGRRTREGDATPSSS